MQHLAEQLYLFHDISCLRTSPAFFRKTKAKTSKKSLSVFAKSKPPMFNFLNLKNGNAQEWSQETNLALLGERSTLNFGEFPNVVKECSLWQILEPITPIKYCLSLKAIAGVERRIKERGKKISKILGKAMDYMKSEFWELADNLDKETLVMLTDFLGKFTEISAENSPFSTKISKEKVIAFHLQQDPLTGAVAPCLGGQKQSTVGVAFYDYHGQDKRIKETDISPTCIRTWGIGGNNLPLVTCLSNAKNFSISDDGKSPTLNCPHEQHAVIFHSLVRLLTPLTHDKVLIKRKVSARS